MAKPYADVLRFSGCGTSLAESLGNQGDVVLIVFWNQVVDLALGNLSRHGQSTTKDTGIEPALQVDGGFALYGAGALSAQYANRKTAAKSADCQSFKSGSLGGGVNAKARRTGYRGGCPTAQRQCRSSGEGAKRRCGAVECNRAVTIECDGCGLCFGW